MINPINNQKELLKQVIRTIEIIKRLFLFNLPFCLVFQCVAIALRGFYQYIFLTGVVFLVSTTTVIVPWMTLKYTVGLLSLSYPLGRRNVAAKITESIQKHHFSCKNRLITPVQQLFL